MPLLHSEAEAALLEAGALSHRLAARYQQAAEQLADYAENDDRDATMDELRQAFADYAGTLSEQADRLDQAARDQELLPREPETELETLKQLADRIQTLMEDRRGKALAQRFAGEEQTLLEELEQAATLDPCPDSVTESLRAGRERISALAGFETS